eukprot:CAMPEP_0184344324 /NCGR_PEP_ID=MMETSP1089-20130417/12840_1 /TAXON_ID=38269 ORGANISM="Gloeochaete wittrockiana, Strain SAG46.84" /NCGR_SAMPLE_ID=MMETSP1089 /ASSEMBLY_ACC=CAM_ASM_000445 /LENGTH=195 /DNA_ID=CAMNT_0026674107 /DNA_START=28 /DNA_END=616 /DNA_ORIENTATION=-
MKGGVEEDDGRRGYLEDHTAAVEVVGVLEESLGLETEIGRAIHDVLKLLSTFKKIVHCAHDNLLGVLEVALDLQHRVSLVGVLVAPDESLELWDRQVNVIEGTFPLSTVDVAEALEGLLDEAEGDTLWVVVRAYNSTGQVVAAHDDVAKMLLVFDAHPSPGLALCVTSLETNLQSSLAPPLWKKPNVETSYAPAT